MKAIEVLFTPADFAGLRRRNLDDTVCVVFDVFRATTTIVTALANGASEVIPVGEIPEALEIRARQPDVLLAGERDGVRIPAALTGGVEFDLGNSPREFTRDKVAGRTIVITTTNGTRALRSCAHARSVYVASFLNMKATMEAILREDCEQLLIVCSGTFDQAAYEDVLGAGALCDLLWKETSPEARADSAFAAWRLYQIERGDLATATANGRNGRRLLGMPELRDDVPYCLQRDQVNVPVALESDGAIRTRPVRPKP